MTTVRRGRRMAARRPRQADRGAIAAAALLAVAVVAALLGGTGTPAEDGGGAGAGVLVDHAIDGCSTAESRRGTRTTVVTGAAPLDGLTDDGGIRYGEPGAGLAAAPPRTPARGQLLEPSSGPADPALLAVEATGSLAAGLFTFRADTGDTTTAVSRCASPRSRWWFTGAAATLTHTSELVLANLDPGPAVVDVRVLGPDGAVETLGTRGISVPPATRTTIPLTDIAPQGEDLAVSVVASRGRVVAAVADSFAPGFGDDEGAEWLPDQAAPSRVLRLAGLPARADSHVLVVANPSPLEALVEVQVADDTGSFTPTENGQVRVPPGAVVSAELTQAIPRAATAIRLTSPVRVTATVRSTANADTSYAGPVRTLTGPAAAPLPDGLRGTVQLTGGERGGTAAITAYDAKGQDVDSTTVQVAAGATSTWSPRGKAAYLVVAPRSGRVYGAVTYAGDQGLSQVALRPLVVRTLRPHVEPVVG